MNGSLAVVVDLPDYDPDWQPERLERLHGRPPEALSSEPVELTSRPGSPGHLVVGLPRCDGVYELHLRHRLSGHRARLGLSVVEGRWRAFAAHELPAVLFELQKPEDPRSCRKPWWEKLEGEGDG